MNKLAVQKLVVSFVVALSGSAAAAESVEGRSDTPAPSEPAPNESESSSGLFFHTSAGVGGGYFHYLNGDGDVPGFSWHANVFVGAHFGPFGVAIGGHFQPLLGFPGGVVAPGGFGGVMLALRPANRVQIDLMTGFGGMGIKDVFGGIGPAWAPGLSIDVLRKEHIAVNVGVRVNIMFLWEPDTRRAAQSVYVAPNASVGFTYW